MLTAPYPTPSPFRAFPRPLPSGALRHPLSIPCHAAPLDRQLYYHRLGTSQSEDILCYEAPDKPNWMCGAGITDDGDYAVLSISESTDPVNRLFIAALEGKGVGGTCALACERSGLRWPSNRAVSFGGTDGSCRPDVCQGDRQL